MPPKNGISKASAILGICAAALTVLTGGAGIIYSTLGIKDMKDELREHGAYIHRIDLGLMEVKTILGTIKYENKIAATVTNGNWSRY